MSLHVITFLHNSRFLKYRNNERGVKEMSTINTSYYSSVTADQSQYVGKVSPLPSIEDKDKVLSVSSSTPQDSVEISQEAQDKIKADVKEKASQSAGGGQSAGGAQETSSSSTVDSSISQLEKQIAALEKEIAALEKKSDDKYNAQLLVAKQAQLATLQAQLLTLESQATSA